MSLQRSLGRSDRTPGEMPRNDYSKLSYCDWFHHLGSYIFFKSKTVFYKSLWDVVDIILCYSVAVLRVLVVSVKMHMPLNQWYTKEQQGRRPMFGRRQRMIKWKTKRLMHTSVVYSTCTKVTKKLGGEVNQVPSSRMQWSSWLQMSCTFENIVTKKIRVQY